MKTFAAMMMVCLGMVCMADNMLVNGDMKTNKGWKIWGAVPKDPAIRGQILTYVNEGPEGERVLKFNDIAPEHNPYLIQHFPVSGITPAQKYKFVIEAKVPAGKRFRVSVQMVGGKKYLGSIGETEFIGTGDWKEYKAIVTGLKAEATQLSTAIYPFWPAKSPADTGFILIKEVDFELAD